MRLTLRTLLAYLDDVLEPADAHELGQKIEQSEFASGLVHRIRSVSRKLRLGAPKLSGKGMGLDPNTVAEYLDSTLPSDRVPDFEKVCIESDVHLAEVASCHQILTLVLGEPADVDPALRDRIRALNAAVTMPGEPRQMLDEPRQENDVIPLADGQPVAPPVDARRTDRETPEPPAPGIEDPAPLVMPVGPRIRVLPVVGTLLVAFLLALVALLAMGPLDENHPILGRFLPKSATQTAARTPENRSDTSPQAASGVERKSSQPAGDQKQKDDQETPGTPAADTSLPPSPPPPAQPTPSAKPPALPDTGTAASKLPDEPEKAGSATPESPNTAPEPSMAVEGGNPAMAPKPDAGSKTGVADAAKSVAPAGQAGSKASNVPEKSADVGRFTSDQHVLARFDADSGSWFRLPTLSPLAPGNRLIALPTYRPQLLLAPGIQLVLVGPAEITLQAPDATGIPTIAIRFGRLVLVTDGKPGSALNVRFGVRQVRILFPSADSMVAVEARSYLPPGVDPETFEAYHVMRFYALGGRVEWQDSEAKEPAAIDSGHEAILIDRELPVVRSGAAKPRWLDSASMPLIDRDASKQLEPLLVPDRPLSLSLQEQIDNRLVEVRTLALRCLAMFDQYDAFVDALNNEDLRSYWSSLMDALRDAIARDPRSAERVRTTLERLRGEDGTTMYRLLVGFSPDQLRAGAAGQLVDLLASPSMDVRVLAFENLTRITQRNHMYRPERDSKRQKRSILNWQKTLAQGGIVYKVPPPKMPERVPGAPKANAATKARNTP